jgi:hypothetical protein
MSDRVCRGLVLDISAVPALSARHYRLSMGIIAAMGWVLYRAGRVDGGCSIVFSGLMYRLLFRLCSIGLNVSAIVSPFFVGLMNRLAVLAHWFGFDCMALLCLSIE